MVPAFLSVALLLSFTDTPVRFGTLICLSGGDKEIISQDSFTIIDPAFTGHRSLIGNGECGLRVTASDTPSALRGLHLGLRTTLIPGKMSVRKEVVRA